jgi:antitoxin FitA
MDMPSIQIRDVPPGTHRVLKLRAAQAGLSLSDFLMAELNKLASRPTTAEWLASTPPIRVHGTPAEVEAVLREVRQERDSG